MAIPPLRPPPYWLDESVFGEILDLVAKAIDRGEQRLDAPFTGLTVLQAIQVSIALQQGRWHEHIDPNPESYPPNA